MKTNQQQIARVVEAANNAGLDAMVAEMPSGDVRVFVDAASKFYRSKFTTILPFKYIKQGTSYVAVFKNKEITDPTQLKKLQEKAKKDPITALRLHKVDGKYYYKTGKAKTMTRGEAAAIKQAMRREAGYEPRTHRPNTRPGQSRAMKRSWAERKD